MAAASAAALRGSTPAFAGRSAAKIAGRAQGLPAAASDSELHKPLNLQRFIAYAPLARRLQADTGFYVASGGSPVPSIASDVTAAAFAHSRRRAAQSATAQPGHAIRSRSRPCSMPARQRPRTPARAGQSATGRATATSPAAANGNTMPRRPQPRIPALRPATAPPRNRAPAIVGVGTARPARRRMARNATRQPSHERQDQYRSKATAAARRPPDRRGGECGIGDCGNSDRDEQRCDQTGATATPNNRPDTAPAAAAASEQRLQPTVATTAAADGSGCGSTTGQAPPPAMPPHAASQESRARTTATTARRRQQRREQSDAAAAPAASASGAIHRRPSPQPSSLNTTADGTPPLRPAALRAASKPWRTIEQTAPGARRRIGAESRPHAGTDAATSAAGAIRYAANARRPNADSADAAAAPSGAQSQRRRRKREPTQPPTTAGLRRSAPPAARRRNRAARRQRQRSTASPRTAMPAPSDMPSTQTGGQYGESGQRRPAEFRRLRGQYGDPVQRRGDGRRQRPPPPFRLPGLPSPSPRARRPAPTSSTSGSIRRNSAASTCRLDVDSSGQVTSHVTADRPETLHLLQSQQPQLERALEQAGLKTADNGLQFTLRDQSFAGQNNRRRRAAATRAAARHSRRRSVARRDHANLFRVWASAAGSTSASERQLFEDATMTTTTTPTSTTTTPTHDQFDRVSPRRPPVSPARSSLPAISIRS